MALLLTKKAELAQKARKEIADYLAAGKDERARIRVEHIIREDYMVEAMEILELYCDLLLSRIGLVQSMKYVSLGASTALVNITANTTYWLSSLCFLLLSFSFTIAAFKQRTRPGSAGGCFHSHLGGASPSLRRV